jgi:PKD domain/Dockerin type I domain
VGRERVQQSERHQEKLDNPAMKKKSSSKSAFINARNLLGVLLCLSGISLAMLSFGAAPTKRTARAKMSPHPNAPTAPTTPSPTSDTLSTSHRSITYTDSTGSLTNPSAVALGKPDCTVPMSCSTFDLTIDSSVGNPVAGYDPTQYEIFINEAWGLSANDYDTFVEDAAGNVVAQNLSTADPETITLPTSIAPGLYHIILVMATGAPVPYTGTVVLQPKPAVSGNCVPPNSPACAPPRYFNYPAGPAQANNAGEPSLGVDWNPNVASLKDTTSADFTTGIKRLNTGGVAFFTSGPNEWRANFDDCPSPAINVWDDVSATTTQQFVLSDPIGFVDHYTSGQLGLVYPPPHTPGRVFTIDLLGGQGDSAGSYSDVDGNSYLPPNGGAGGTGGPGQGPDHETLGGGPYNPNSTPPPPPQPSPYPATGTPNAIYYCSQNIVGEAQCSRSDAGGVAGTFGPGVPIYNPSVCSGGIHGHVKVAPDGTVYVPNSSCGVTYGTVTGGDGVAVSTDNGLTWTENNVHTPGHGSDGSQDPSVGVGQNNVGKVGLTNTIYLGWVGGNGHPHVADSHDRGVTWENDTDIGALITDPVTNAVLVTHAVFPVVVAGDDNRAAFGFLGTGDGIATNPPATCDPYGATLNCANIWHLYIATTYDGGAHWIIVDATPNDPVQQGTICLQGTTCAGGRNLLDFNDFAVDAEGRGLVGYADGCVDCNNTFQGQSSANHGTIARQAGGRRLFQAFDPIEPMPPASPQLVSAVTQSPGALITWLEPDNGGSPITSYNVYRGTTSGMETFLATVSGETTTKYFDPTPPPGDVFYYVRATNAPRGTGDHCGEVSLGGGGPTETECIPPGLTKLTDPAGDNSACVNGIGPPTPAPPGSDLLKFQIAQPYQPDGIPRLVFTITTDNGQSPQPPGSSWYVAMKVPVSAQPSGYKAVHMTWNGTTPTFESYTPGANNAGGVDGRFVVAGSQKPAEATSNYIAPFNKVIIVVKASDLGLNPGDTISGFVSAVSQTEPMVGAVTCLYDDMPDGLGYTGSYTVEDNQAGVCACKLDVAPTAVLTATPMSGVAPLTVNFDASGSFHTPPPSNVITSYTLDFGDGTPPVTQASPMFSHTYNSNGDYPARLTATDPCGKTSTSAAQVVISVTSTLTEAQSVKFHTGVGSFPVELPLVGSPRGVECRTSGNGTYTIVYTFNGVPGRGITAVDSAKVTQGTATIDTTNTRLGPNANQYTVALTGVTNAQYVYVQLDGVHDTAGAVINQAIARVGILVGDVTGDGQVDSADLILVKRQTLQPVNNNPGTSNFREDVNVDGAIDSGDLIVTKRHTLTGLTPPP